MGKDSKNSGAKELLPNPLVGALVPGARRLTGYVGRADNDATLRVHPDVDRLEQYVEFNKSDVLHHEPDPTLPHGATHIWLKPHSAVTTTLSRRINIDEVPHGLQSKKQKKLVLNRQTIGALTTGAAKVKPSDFCSHQTDDFVDISGCRGCDSVDIKCSGGCPGTDDMGCTWSMPC